MAANQPYLPKPIQQGDTRGWNGYEHNGLMHQGRRIETRQPLTIAKLEQGKVYELNFANKLKHNLLITGISADIEGDDGNLLQEGTNNFNFSYVQCIIQTLEKETKRVLRTINIYISSYPNYLNELLLSPDNLYRIRVNQTVNDITALAIPVILEQPVVFISPPVVEPQPEIRGRR